MKIEKKLRVIFIITFFVICLFGSFVNASSETAYDIGEYIIDATIMKNGDLHVVEKIRFDFHASANGIYRDILFCYEYDQQKNDMTATSSRYQASNIYNILVTETDSSYNDITNYTEIYEESAKNGMEDVFSVSSNLDNGYRKKIKIYIPSSSGDKKSLKIEYDIKNVAVLYQDKGEIYWNFVGSDWNNRISNLKVNINFEGNSNTLIKLYPHGYTKIKNISSFTDKLSFEVPKLSPRIAIDARVVFSNEYLDSEKVLKKVKENYNFEEVEKIEKGMKVGKIRYNLSNIILIAIIVITVIYLIMLIKKFIKVLSKGKVKKPDYYTQPLENLNLSVYTKLNGGYLLNPNLLMATILDLKQKKILDMDSRKRLKKSLDGIEYDYYLTINENADLSNLNEYEIIVLNFLFNRVFESEIIEFKKVKIELNETLKRLSSDNIEMAVFRRLCISYDKKIHETIYEKPDKGMKKFSFIGFLIIIIISFINNFVISPFNLEQKIENLEFYFLGGFFIMIVAIIAAYVRSIKAVYYDEYNKLKGLERYLKDYSLIKDRYPIEIALWDRYLVFATLFGIAKKVAKEFKEELIKNGYDDNYIYSNYPSLSMSMYSSQISSYASSFTGSISSGGFSGGGSGGGGGRWWRWRFFLGFIIC